MDDQTERRSPHPLILEIHGDMKVLKDRQETMYEQLFGNGQPGELHHIKNRIGKLEKWQWMVIGGFMVLTTVGGILIKVLMK